MSKKGHVPIRMCIGCRKKRKKEEMIRFIQNPEGVMCWNGKRHLSGRGFYLCPVLECLNMAKKKYREIGFLKMGDLQYPSAKEFF